MVWMVRMWIGAPVHLFICLWAWVLESGALLKFQCILVFFKLEGYKFYRGSLEKFTVDLWEIGSQYLLDIKIP